jgi:hypothetical protein
LTFSFYDLIILKENSPYKMKDFNYREYSLSNLENWLHDAISSGEASPHEIYSLIRRVVKENYEVYDERAKNCLGLLELLSGHRPVNLEDKVVKWQLPVEFDYKSGEYYVMFPNDLLDAANLKEGDQVEWVDQNDGSFILKKVS